MYPGFMSERFLAELLFTAEPANVSTEAFANIHDIAKTLLSPIDLQTMSDKSC